MAMPVRSLVAQVYKHRHVLLPLFVVISSACLCQYDPFAHEYTSTPPPEAEVVGTYVLTRQTLNRVPIEKLTALDGSGPSTIKLILYDDNRFEAVNLPVWIEGSSNGWTVYKFVSLSGTWGIDIVGAVSDGTKKIAEVWGIVLSSDKAPSVQVTLAGEKPPYKLIFGYGDPDGGYAMIYEREDAVK
jgi:hypothetical protein